MKVALVHDWLTGMRGGERVLERVARMWPEAPIYTLVWRRGSVSRELESHPIVTSFLQHLPGGVRHYRWYLPLFPTAIESFDFSGYDVLISTSHAVAKAAITPPGAFHFCYVHTPMRYVWDLEQQYFPPGRFPWPLSWAVPADLRRADGAGDVVVAGRDVGGQRSQGIEGRLVALLQLDLHVLLDELHRHMARAFDHHLDIVFPGNFRELSQGS